MSIFPPLLSGPTRSIGVSWSEGREEELNDIEYCFGNNLTMIDILKKRIDIRATSDRVDKLEGVARMLEEVRIPSI